MSFKTKKISKNFLTEFKIKDKNSKEKDKEKENLKKLMENIENESLPFALIKLAINNNFLPLTIDTYYEKILPDIEYLRKKDGSKYEQNSINSIKSALVSNKLFERKHNKLYGLNIPEVIKYIKTLKKKDNDKNTTKKDKINKEEKEQKFLGKKRAITKNLIINKHEKYQHGFQILNDLLESYPKKIEDKIKIKTNFNKYKSSTQLIEKTMDINKICGMLITFKYFQPFLKKFLYSKSNDISYNKKRMLNQQIFGLKDDLDLVQFFIKQIENSKNIEANN